LINKTTALTMINTPILYTSPDLNTSTKAIKINNEVAASMDKALGMGNHHY
jgi:hypothetical protein